jgi:hypothetical protein
MPPTIILKQQNKTRQTTLHQFNQSIIVKMQSRDLSSHTSSHHAHLLRRFSLKSCVVACFEQKLQSGAPSFFVREYA